MTQRQYSIRIGLDGKAEIDRDFDGIEQKGEGAADSIGRAFDDASTKVGNFTKSAKDSAAVFQTFGKSGGAVTSSTDFEKTLQRLKAEQDAIVSAQKQAQMQIASQSGLNASFGIGAAPASARESATAFEAQFAQMEEIARQKAAQIGQTFQTTLNESFGFGSTGKSAKESAAVFSEAFTEEEAAQRDAQAQMMREAKEFFDEYHALQQAKAEQIGQTFQTTLNESMGIGTSSKSARESAAVFEDEAKAMAALDERAGRLKAQIDPLGAAQARLAAEIKNADELLAANKVTMAEHTAYVAQAQRTYDVTAKSLHGVTNEARLNSFQISNLTFQINDVVSGLAMGQKPLSVLTQQGGQIIQVFAGSGMGVMGALKATAATIASFLTPTVLLGGAIAAVGATAAYVIYTNWQASRQLQAGTEGLGRAAGATAGDLSLLASSASDAGHLSVGAARDTAVAFAQTGMVGKESIGDLIDLTERYARATDGDMDKARESMVAAFKDPAKAGIDLLAKIGGLDDKTGQLIRTMVAQGNYTGAQTLLQQNLNRVIDDSTDKTTAWGDAWNYVGKQWAQFVDAWRPDTLEEKRLAIVAQIDAMKQSNLDPSVYQRELQQFDSDNAAALAASAQKSAADRARQNAQTLSNVAGPVVRSAIPGFQDQFDLSTSSVLVDKLLANSDAMKLLGVTTDQARQAQDALTSAKVTYLNPAERAETADRLEIEAMQHFTVAERAQDAARRSRLETSGKVLTAAEVEREAQAASAKVYATATREIASQTIELDRNTKSALATGDAYLQSAAAGMVAEARAKAVAEAFRDGVNVETRTRQLLREEIAQDYATGAKQVEQLGRHTDAQKKVNDALANGTLTIGDANEQMQIEVALANLRIAKTLALSQGYTAEANALQKVIDKLPSAYANDNDEARRNQALRTLSSQSDQVDLVKRELALQGESANERAVELAQLRTKQQLLQQGISINGTEGKQIIANAGEIERLNQQLQLANASRGELESTFDSVASTWSDFIVQGKYDWNSFAQAGLSAVKDIESEIIKLAMINPLKNMLTGSNLPTWDSMGGVLGSLFGGTADESVSVTGTRGLVLAGVHHGGGMIGSANDNRMLPAHVVRFAPRAHDGLYLKPDERVIVAQTGERVLNRDETRRYNGGSGGPLTVNQYIQTPNPRAFQASKGQALTSLVRGIRAAAARM